MRRTRATRPITQTPDVALLLYDDRGLQRRSWAVIRVALMLTLVAVNQINRSADTHDLLWRFLYNSIGRFSLPPFRDGKKSISYRTE